MELEEATKLIPEMILFLIGLSIVLYINAAGLGSIDLEIDKAQQKEYRKTIILENLLSLSGDKGKTSSRTVVPIKYFRESGKTGFERNEGHCYIEDAAAMTGHKFGFYIKVFENYAGLDIECRTSRGKNPVSSPFLIYDPARKEQNLYISARIYVYERK